MFVDEVRLRAGGVRRDQPLRDREPREKFQHMRALHRSKRIHAPDEGTMVGDQYRRHFVRRYAGGAEGLQICGQELPAGWNLDDHVSAEAE